MKRYNLNDTWKYCLQMWKHIASQKKDNCFTSVDYLKKRWLKDHGFKPIYNDCFFCYYTRTHVGNGCDICPGCKVDKSFSCMSTSYYHSTKPIKFYAKIKKLNKIRLEAK